MFSNDEQSDSKFQRNMHTMTQAFSSEFNINTNDVANKPKANDNNHNDNNDEKNKSDNNSNRGSSSSNSSNNMNFPNNNKNNGANVANAANAAAFKEDGDCNSKVKEMVLELDKIAQGCFDNDEHVYVECCKRIRKLLSVEKNPPIDEVVSTGVVPRLIQFLGNKYNNNPKLQFEAAWALTNVASSNTENTAVVIKNNGVSHFVNLMLSNNRDIAEQATWALGNIAGASPYCRDIVLASGGLINLQKLQNRCIGILNSTALQNGWKFEQLFQDSKMLPLIELLRNATWTLSNFCRGKPQPNIKYIKDAIQALTVMLTLPDAEILQDAAWGFSYLSDSDDIGSLTQSKKEGGDLDERKHNEKVLLMKQCGALKRLVDCLGHGEYRVRHPALRALGNVVTGSDEQTEDVVNMGVCDKLLPLLDLKQYKLYQTNRNGDKKLNKHGTLLKEACWMISNITAGTEEQIEKVVLSNIFPSLINFLEKVPFEIRKEATWAIVNATRGGSKHQIEYLVHRGVVAPLVSLLKLNNPKVVLVAMEGLNNILKCGEEIQNETGADENKFAIVVEAAGGADKFMEIQKNNKMPDNVFQMAQKLVQDYWPGARV